MTESTWLLTIKPTFLSELLLLAPKEVAQVQKKLGLLAQDPHPDAKVKKRLKGLDGKLHRLRSGDYRIFYTYEHPYISVLSLRLRDDDTFDNMPATQLLGGAMPQGEVSDEPSIPPPGFAERPQPWAAWLTPPEPSDGPLSTPITQEMLDALGVPSRYHHRLLQVGSEDALLNCAVPDAWLMKVVDVVTGRPLEHVANDKDLLLFRPDDLLKFREGELMGFLLKLDPEQEKFVTWAAKAKGATLLKGGPGSGKSTVALYRVRELLKALQGEGAKDPRVLFTTYTKALVRYSKQLLEQLLGDDVRCVDVRTADDVAYQLAHSAGMRPQRTDSAQLRTALRKAVDAASFEGNPLTVRAQQKTIERLGQSYLLSEILDVIEGRNLQSFEAYAEAERPGRKLPLNKTQRMAVWKVRQQFVRIIDQEKLSPIQRIRWYAAKALEEGLFDESYDAVVVDEAQDLSASLIRTLAGLCVSPNRLFLTADANQSIYGGSFRWQDVHGWLKFKGRTGLLKANYRCTREISEAAHHYLSTGAIDQEKMSQRYAKVGPLPAVRRVPDAHSEAAMIGYFFRQAAKEYRLGLGSCAVLCPTNKAAKAIAAKLGEHGIVAEHMTGDQLDLEAPVVKTMTLHSAKGLEFPIVALAGFVDARYPHISKGASAEEQQEIFERERRTLFVAMTRAMRALLVVLPEHVETPLLQGFDPALWNLGMEAAA